MIFKYSLCFIKMLFWLWYFINFTCIYCIMKIPFIKIINFNFYSFEEAAAKHVEETELTNSIDIGGPSMLRAAAKNNKRVLAVSSPNQYNLVLDDLKEHNGETSLKLRREFALKVFENTIDFDTKVLNELSNRYEEDTDNYFSLNIKKAKNYFVKIIMK